MDRYVFMTMAVGDGYGGLEHRASTALICARADLPTTASSSKEIGDGYLKFGLCSHEYFHTWNVKRIKPAAFAPYNLQAESYSPLLWLFEGFTSYYDDLMLVRGPDRRGSLFQAAGQNRQQRPARQRPHQAERGRFQLRRLGQVLPPG
jgi:predicted metalloprotease with PDZ domain